MKTDSVESRKNKEQYLITKLKPKMNQIFLYTKGPQKICGRIDDAIPIGKP